MSANLIVLDDGSLALAPGAESLLTDEAAGGCCCSDDGGSCDDCCNRVNSDGSKCCYVAAADGAGDVYVVNSGSMIIMTWWDYNSDPCQSGSPCPNVPAPCTLLSDSSKLPTTGYSRCSWTMTEPAAITDVTINCPFPPMTIYREYVLFRGFGGKLCTTGNCSETPDDRSYSETVEVTSEITRETTGQSGFHTHWVSQSVRGGYAVGSRGMCERVFGPKTTNCSTQNMENQFRCAFGQRPDDDCYDVEVFIDTGCICPAAPGGIDHSAFECGRAIYTHSLHMNRSDLRCNTACNACAA